MTVVLRHVGDDVEIVQADDTAEFSSDLLANADERYVQQGEGLIRFTTPSRVVVYRITGSTGLPFDNLTAVKIRDSEASR